MITLVTGKIGSGKSLFCLVEALRLLSNGQCVASNFAFNLPEVDRWLWRNKKRRLYRDQIITLDFEAEPNFYRNIPFGVNGCPVTVFCDEAQLYYNQADGARLQQTLKQLGSFLTQSRKCKVDIWFITQYDTTVWAQARHQCLFMYRCRDMRAISLPFIGKIPAAGLHWVKVDTQSGEVMQKGRTPLTPDLFKLYDTNQMFDSQMRELQASANVWDPKESCKETLFPAVGSEDAKPEEPFSLAKWLLTH